MILKLDATETMQPSLTTELTRRATLAGLGAVGASAVFAGSFVTGTSPAAAQRVAEGTMLDLDEVLKPGPIGDRSIGSADAPVTIVEYASMTCGHCGSFHQTVYPQLKEKYIDTGKVRFIFREYPLDNYAAAASMLARCLDEDKFFPFIDVMFKQQRSWAYVQPNQRIETLKKLGRQAGITEEKFNTCLRDQALLDGIKDAKARATSEFGVRSTPTFILNGKLLPGGRDLEGFEAEMEPYLGG